MHEATCAASRRLALPRGHRPTRALLLFASTIGLSAFLLFLVQPLIAKQILPWFGGSAAVWTTCLVFFQVALLAGYAYSDFVARRLQPRQQARLHTGLLLLSLLMLPITPSLALRPEDADNPTGRILLLLTLTIGLPYLMLATTGPLVQAWFARRFAGTPTAGSVWRLYALSNAASLLALISYPPLIEPLATVRWQSWGWSIGYVVFVLLAGASAWLATRGPLAQTLQVTGGTASAPPEPAAAAVAAPGWREQGLWLLLAGLGSVLLLTVTTHVTQNIASVPFLWVLPLVLYLTSFILTFDGQGWYRRGWTMAAAAVMAMVMMAGLTFRPAAEWQASAGLETLFERGLLPLHWALPIYVLGLFVLCMFLHGELVHRKPSALYLTRFYLMVSLGGALGGLSVGIAAPLLLNWTWELPLALFLCALLVALLSPAPARGFGLMAAFVCALLAHQYTIYVRDDAVEISRNFYGTLRMKATAGASPDSQRLRMLHGVILHGEQFTAPQYRAAATTYYGTTSGVGRALLGLRALEGEAPLRMGLVGLGVGTLAAYGRSGDTVRVYELNPAVLDLAQRRFTYLADSAAQVSTALGDARLVLAREAPQGMHLLAVDAFSSDSIPVHLLTREAMAVYVRHLRPGGVVAFHISNRYLDLKPVVQQLAQGAGMTAWWVADKPADDSPLFTSDWVLVTGNTALIQAFQKAGVGQALDAPLSLRPWTDDYNNLVDVLR